MLPCGFSDTPTSANSWSMVNTICQDCWKVVYSIAFSWKKQSLRLWTTQKSRNQQSVSLDSLSIDISLPWHLSWIPFFFGRFFPHFPFFLSTFSGQPFLLISLFPSAFLFDTLFCWHVSLEVASSWHSSLSTDIFSSLVYFLITSPVSKCVCVSLHLSISWHYLELF